MEDFKTDKINIPINIKLLVYMGFSSALGGLFVLYFLFGPPQVMAYFESVEFCSTCHIVEPMAEHLFHSVHSDKVSCVDCHLPNGNVIEHYVQKSWQGVIDPLVFYTNNVPDELKASAGMKKIVQDNCVRCHGQMVSEIDNKRQCWDCHRRLYHGRPTNH
jgi:cytochrome c nitrite reductase small subunit